MSLLFRGAARPVERRAWSGPFGDQNTVPSPSQDGGGSYRYSTADALRVAAVVACVGLRAGAFAQLPIKCYRDRNGIPEAMPVQPELFTSPSDFAVPSVWKTQMSISRDLWGFALGRVTALDGAFYPRRVDWFNPSTIRYRLVGGAPVWSEASGGELDSSMLVHVPSRWVMPGNPVGMSPLEHSGLVDLAKRAQDFGRDWFANGAVPSSIIYSDQVLDGPEADAIVETVRAKWRSRKTAVLGSGLRYEKVSVPANESQFIETCNKVAADIATSFNLPPSKIGAAISGQNVTYSNRDQDQMAYLIDSINPDLVVIQESLDRHTAPGQYSKFSTGAFLRSDLKTRYEAHKIGIDAHFLTPNEVRALEELPPIEGGNTFPSLPGGGGDPLEVASAKATESLTRQLQQIYLAVGTVITADEAREILNRNGAGLTGLFSGVAPTTTGGS